MEEPNEDVEARIEQVVGAFHTFEFQAARLRTFEWRGIYLTPEPAESFILLIDQLMEVFTGTTPYWKRYGGEIVPHIAALSPYLPIQCSAREVTHPSIRPSEVTWDVLGRYLL